MEKHILSIAGLGDNNELGYGKTKIINECLFYEEEPGERIGNCVLNHLSPCTLKQRELYFDYKIYTLSFL